MRFHFKEIKHVPGKQMHIADALSRLQVRDQMVQSTIDDDDMVAYVGSVISSLPASDTRLQQIVEAQDEDPVCSQIKVYCYEGWPDKYSLFKGCFETLLVKQRRAVGGTKHPAKAVQNRNPVLHSPRHLR